MNPKTILHWLTTSTRNWRSVVFGLVCLCLFATGVAAEEKTYPVFPPCGYYEDTLFEEIDFTVFQPDNPDLETVNALDDWSALYHNVVERVIEESIGELQGSGFSAMRRRGNEPSCTDLDDGELGRPLNWMGSLARSLPSWDEGEPLTQSEMGPVLLEYLRLYECALIERSTLPEAYIKEEEVRRRAQMQGSDEVELEAMEVSNPSRGMAAYISQEIRIARASLNRALTLVSSLEKLRPLDTELLCLQRSSLDIRNSFALAADAASCMPRIWDAKTPLRDIKDPPVTP